MFLDFMLPSSVVTIVRIFTTEHTSIFMYSVASALLKTPIYPTLDFTHASFLFFCIFQIGPGLVYLTFENWMIKGCFLHTITPQKPLEQRMIHQVYASSVVPTILAKFFMLSEALMVSPMKCASWGLNITVGCMLTGVNPSRLILLIAIVLLLYFGYQLNIR